MQPNQPSVSPNPDKKPDDTLLSTEALGSVHDVTSVTTESSNESEDLDQSPGTTITPTTITPTSAETPVAESPETITTSDSTPNITTPNDKAINNNESSDHTDKQPALAEAQPALPEPSQEHDSQTNNNPANPTSPTGEVASPPTASTFNAAGGQNNSKKKWLLLAIIAAILVIVLGLGYTFAFYLPNQPGNVFNQSLNNTAKGYDKLVTYINQVDSKKYKGSTINGSLKLSSEAVSADGTLNTQSYNGNATGTLNLDLAGEKISTNLRAITASGQKIPDVYLQANGVKSILDSLGMTNLDKLDGQWISVDHTLIDSTAKSSKVNANIPSEAQINDAMSKIGTVNHNYLLSTGSNAVLTNQKYLGKSTQDGRTVYGYTVGYNKTHLISYVQALGTALDKSSLNDWIKQVSGGKSASAVMTAPKVDQLSSNYTFTLYVDAKTKLPHSVHFPVNKDSSVKYYDLGLNYTGGNSYPFTLKAQANDNGTVTNFTLSFTLHTDTNKIDLGANVDVTSGSGGKTQISGTFAVTPSNTPVNVSAPAGAKPLNEVMQSFGLNGSDLSGLSDNSSATDLFTTQ